MVVSLTTVSHVDFLGDGLDDATAVRIDILRLQPVPKLVTVLNRVHLPREVQNDL